MTKKMLILMVVVLCVGLLFLVEPALAEEGSKYDYDKEVASFIGKAFNLIMQFIEDFLRLIAETIKGIFKR